MLGENQYRWVVTKMILVITNVFIPSRHQWFTWIYISFMKIHNRFKGWQVDVMVFQWWSYTYQITVYEDKSMRGEEEGSVQWTYTSYMTKMTQCYWQYGYEP